MARLKEMAVAMVRARLKEEMVKGEPAVVGATAAVEKGEPARRRCFGNKE